MGKNHCHRNLFFPALLVLLLTGCGTTLKTEQPPEYYGEAGYIPAYSYVNLPFEIDVAKLEGIINKQFIGLIYSDTSFDDNDHDNLMVRAWKTGDLHLSAAGNQLIYSVPLHVLIRKRFEIGPSMLNLTDISEITSDMILKFRTRIVLNPDWTVSTTTLSDGYEWVSTPSVKIGLVSIPLPMVSDMILNSNQKDINSGIDHALMEYFDLLSAMKQVWKEIQVPIRITGEYPIWAKITPYEIRAVPITALSGVIRFTAGIKARSELFYGNEPEYQVSDSLPFLKITSLLENDFNLNLVLDIPFRHINDLTQQQLAGFRMTEGKYTVTVKDVFLYGNGDNLVVALNVDGSIRGTIYLTGKPLYDPEKRSITVAGLDFDIRTKNVLLKSASWIFHHGLIKAIASKLEFPVGDQLQLIRKSVQSYLDQDTKLDYFRISGNLDKLDIQGILITKSSVKAVFNLSGKISVSLN